MKNSDRENKGSSAEIVLKKDFSIGYTSSLAKVKEEIQLTDGTHYLLARNGRGKTTLLRTLANVIKPIHPGFSLNGKVQLLAEDLCFDRELSASSILKCFLKKPAYREAMELADTLELEVKKSYGKLSTGNKRKVALLMAEFSVDPNQPEILLLDEPFTGLDSFAREIFQDLWRRKNQGVLRLVSAHPDFDNMVLESSVLITHEEILHLSGGDTPKEWRELKAQLA